MTDDDRESLTDDMRAMGATAQQISDYLDSIPKPKAPDDDGFEVWPENWPVLQIFLRLRTQWRISEGMDGAQVRGLDYSGVESFLRLMKTKNTPAVMGDLQIMEIAAIDELRKLRA